MTTSGPLAGLRVVEFLGIGPGPYCAMLLADLGAEVLRVARPGGNGYPNAIVDRGRATLTLDLRNEEAREQARAICDRADVLIEGFRPGAMERMGLGPDDLLPRNPRLVYGRLTGWGQDGPLAKAAGHDITYIALTGALAAIGKPGEPATPPLNLVGDLGAGSMLLAFGIMAALWERERSGRGQVIDAAMVDGVSSMMSTFAGLMRDGRASMARDANMLAGGAPFYRCYLCADGREIAVGSIEPPFYAQLLQRIGAPPELLARQYDQNAWAADAAALARIFAKQDAAHWCAVLEGTDACFAPVVPLKEAPRNWHLAARGVYVEADGIEQVAPVPRFSRTPGAVPSSRSAEDLIRAWQQEAGRSEP